MRQFEEIGIVNYGTEENKMKPKHLNHEEPVCIWDTHWLNRPKDTYQFLNLETKRIIMSQDGLWMEKVYGNYKKLPQEEIMQFEPEVDTNDDDLDSDLDSDLEVAESVDQVGNI
jgi:hypothetical protein